MVELENSREDLKKQGLGLAAISYDSQATLKHFADRKSIRFPLLSDEDSSVIRAYGILNDSIPKNTDFFGVPHPVTYIVDQNGVIRSRTTDEDYRRRYTVGHLIGRKAGETEVKARRLKLTQSASDTVVRGGQRVKLRLEIELPSRNHVYAPGVQGYIPIDWRLEADPKFEVLPVTYPKSRILYLKAIDEKVPVYEGKFTLEREIIPAQRLPAGDLRVEANLRYQVCDDKQCFIPETVPIVWELKHEPHDPTRVPAELRRKSRP